MASIRRYVKLAEIMNIVILNGTITLEFNKIDHDTGFVKTMVMKRDFSNGRVVDVSVHGPQFSFNTVFCGRDGEFLNYRYTMTENNKICDGYIVIGMDKSLISFQCNGTDLQTGPWITYRYIAGIKLTSNWVKLHAGQWVADTQ